MNQNNDHGCANPHFPLYRTQSRKRLVVVLVLIATFAIIEFIAGIMTNSLALIADVGHMLSDLMAIALALMSMYIAERPPTVNKTFGYYRTEILASLINSVALVVIAIFIFYETAQRISHPPEVLGLPMLIVAIAGLSVNGICIFLLKDDNQSSLNFEGAYLEVLSDLLGSLAVLVAALIIMFTGWRLADPIVSVLIGFMILPRTWQLLVRVTNVLMEGVPEGIELDKLEKTLEALPGVMDVHDLHVWSITSGLNAMSGHVRISGGNDENILAEMTRIAKEDFNIQHTTIQVEREKP